MRKQRDERHKHWQAVVEEQEASGKSNANLPSRRFRTGIEVKKGSHKRGAATDVFTAVDSAELRGRCVIGEGGR